MFGQYWKSPWVRGALIALLVVICYSPVLKAGFVWDDDDYILKNKSLWSAGGFKRIWTDVYATPQYYPLVHTTYWLEYRLWGPQPCGYHATNILLHALATFLLWRVLTKIHPSAAWLAALLFGLHPVCVESVAWVTERKNVLSAVFYFAAALAYLRFLPLDEISTAAAKPSKAGAAGIKSSPRAWRWYGLALGLFVCALLSKTITCSLPAALLLVLWWKRGRVTLRDVVPLLPFFLIGLALALNTSFVEKHRVGAIGPEWEMSFVVRCLIAGRALWFYAGKLVWPSDLTFMYPRWEISAAVWWQWLFPIAVLGVVAMLFLWCAKIGRGPLVAILFFAGTLFPALGFFNIYPMRYSFVADHFQYIACVGLFVAAAHVLARSAFRLGYVLPLALGFLTWQQTHIYDDLETLWRDTIKKNPGCWLAYANLSDVRQAAGNMREAEALCHAALRLKPDYDVALNNLIAVLIYRGRLDEAVVYLERGLAANPNNVPMLVNYGIVLQRNGQIEKAIEYYHRALAINRDDAGALVNMGTALAAQDRHAEARSAFEAAIHSRPDLSMPRIKLGGLLQKMGDNAKAEALFREVIRAAPENRDAHAGLAGLLAAQGRAKEELAELTLLTRLNASAPASNNAAIHQRMGMLFARLGEPTNAVAHWRKTLRLTPDWTDPMNNLAWILATTRDPACRDGAEAVRLAERAAQVNSNANSEALDTLAAAYAENGQWPQAIQTAESALALARASTNQTLSVEILRHLESFRRSQPWRE